MKLVAAASLAVGLTLTGVAADADPPTRAARPNVVGLEFDGFIPAAPVFAEPTNWMLGVTASHRLTGRAGVAATVGWGVFNERGTALQVAVFGTYALLATWPHEITMGVGLAEALLGDYGGVPFVLGELGYGRYTVGGAIVTFALGLGVVLADSVVPDGMTCGFFGNDPCRGFEAGSVGPRVRWSVGWTW